MKTYKPKRKGFINYLLIGFLLLPIAVFFLDKETFAEKPFILLPLSSPLALLLWIYFDTNYRIVNDRLRYRSGFLKGEIDIAKIREIIQGETMWSGIKPALSKNGLIVKFNRYDDIYIAPEDNNQIISDLLEINRNIKVTDKTD